MYRLATPEPQSPLSLANVRPSRLLPFGRLPLVTVAIAACAVIVGVSAPLSSLLQYDRSNIANGEWFRLLTGHIAHWNFDHLLWDVVMFAALGAFLERHNRRLLVATVVVSATAISMSLWYLEPGVLEYRGLSGLDSALFSAALMLAFVESLRARHQVALVATALLGSAMLGKIAYETSTGATLFVDSSAANFEPLPLVHAVGAVAGLLTAAAAYLPWQRTRYLLAAWSLPS